MKVVHLEDMTVTSEREQLFAAVGEGNMNFVRILDACKEIGVEWGPVEQDQYYGSGDPVGSDVVALICCVTTCDVLRLSKFC